MKIILIGNKARMGKDTFATMYVRKYNEKYFYDENLRKMDLYNYNLISEIYSDSGLTLSTRPEGFSGLSLVERDVEDLANLKSEIKNITFTINQIQNSINSNNRSEELRVESCKINEENQNLQQTSITNESQNISSSRELLTKKKDVSDKYKLYRDELDTRTFIRIR